MFNNKKKWEKHTLKNHKLQRNPKDNGPLSPCCAHLAFTGTRFWTFLWQGPGEQNLPTAIGIFWDGKTHWKSHESCLLIYFLAYFGGNFVKVAYWKCSFPSMFPPIWTATMKKKKDMPVSLQASSSTHFFSVWSILFWLPAGPSGAVLLTDFGVPSVPPTWCPTSEFVVTPSPPKRFGDTRGVHPFESTRANALQPVVSMGALIQNCRCFWLSSLDETNLYALTWQTPFDVRFSPSKARFQRVF